MYKALLQLLQASPVIQAAQITELRLYGPDAFQVKVRATLSPPLQFQLWLNHNAHHTRYAYQVFDQHSTLLRWDNAPHHPQIQQNFPHHCHDSQGQRRPSSLIGDPLRDLPVVLTEIAHYLATLPPQP